MSIATIAANVSAALVSVNVATDAASVVKFDAIADFATIAAYRLRVEHIAKGSNLETDTKGRLVALVDITKADRTALVAAFNGAGIGEKDSANIASMARTVALHFVPLMVETGGLRDAEDGDAIRTMIVDRIKEATGGEATYNAIEKARGRKWSAPVVEADDASDDDATDTTDIDMSAPLSPVLTQGEPEAPEPTTDEQVTEAVASAIRTLQGVLDMGDQWERLAAYGGAHLLNTMQAAWRMAEAQRQSDEADAIEAEAAKKTAKLRNVA